MMVKRFFALILALSVMAVAVAQSRQTRAEYVDKYKEIAIKHMERYGIPASITMAQGILESDSGNSNLAKKSNNHFGIKCKSGWTGRSVRHDDDAPQECFRAYDDVEESYRDHAEFLDTGQRYDTLFLHSHTDYKRWARGLKAAGYATAPHYADMLIKIIEEEKLFLLDYEGGAQMYAQRDRYTIDNFDGTPASRVNDASESVVAQMGDGEVIDPDNHRVTINAHKGYNVYRVNDIFYVEAKEDDSIENIASKFDIWRYNLRRFNDLERGAPLVKGEVIYIEEKRSSWRGDNATHTTSEGETISSLSQLYGVKQKALRRLNDLKRTEHQLEKGRVIKLR